MSLPAIASEARRIVEQAALEPSAKEDVLRALAKNGTATPPFLLALGLEAKLSPALVLTRATGVHLNIVALQVMDDIADGDCDYLDPAEGAGTAAQYLLQNLSWAALLDAGLPVAVLRAVALELAGGGSAQSLEVRTEKFSSRAARAMAEGFGGRHYGAYFRLMLHGSAYEAEAAALGYALGIGVAISSDLASNDPRVMSLSRTERAEIISWALAATARASHTTLGCVRAMLDRIDIQLLRAFSLLADAPDRCGAHQVAARSASG